MHPRTKFFLRLFLLFFVLQICVSCSGQNSSDGFTGFGITPNITSEDDDIGSGGHEPPEKILCDDKTLPRNIIMRISSIENGSIINGSGTSENDPILIDIGNTFGFAPGEAPAHVHLEMVSKTANYRVGNDPAEFPLFFGVFILTDPPQTSEFLADFVFNQPVTNLQGVIIGNRIATWSDPDAFFDGILDTEITYALQVCRGYLIDPQSGNTILVRSQPIFIQARLSAP